jgi:tRNA pseudouridine38-40 synthase
MGTESEISDKNIMLILEYEGTQYHGWQRQKEALTIQAVVEDTIRMMVHEPVALIASGRTDAGVHAKHQVCHFLTQTQIRPESIRDGLNALLPDDMYIKKVQYAPLDFHSRYRVKTKTYEYRILARKEPDLFTRNFVWHIRTPLDIDAMRQCMSLLVGKHDFSSFRSTGSGNRDPVREMTRAAVHTSKHDVISFMFEANGFLRHMVRNIVGTVVDVGRGRMGVGDFKEVFYSRDRTRAGRKAPAQGLFLMMVTY